MKRPKRAKGARLRVESELTGQFGIQVGEEFLPLFGLSPKFLQRVGGAFEGFLGSAMSSLEIVELFLHFAKCLQTLLRLGERPLKFGNLVILRLKLGRVLCSAFLLLSCKRKKLVRIRIWFGWYVIRTKTVKAERNTYPPDP